MGKNILEDFNPKLKGSTGNFDYNLEELEVIKSQVTIAKKIGRTVTKEYEKNPWLAIKLKRKDGSEFTVAQMLFFNITGEISSPYSKAYRRKDGKYGPATLAYDIVNAILRNLPEAEQFEYKNMSIWDEEKFLGRKLHMGLKSGKGKVDGKPWYMLETDEQKYYDYLSGKVKAATNEWITDRAMLRDEDDGTYMGSLGGEIVRSAPINIDDLPKDLAERTKLAENFENSKLAGDTTDVVQTPVDDDDLPF